MFPDAVHPELVHPEAMQRSFRAARTGLSQAEDRSAARTVRARARACLAAVCLWACSAHTPPGPQPSPAAVAGSPAIGAPTISSDAFGSFEGRQVERYTLTNAHGLTLKVITYGAIITALEVPDRHGKSEDVVLGFDDLDGYVNGSAYFGAIVGRVANRIRDARFELEGRQYSLAANSGPHHLHGGKVGWDRVLWDAVTSSDAASASVRLTYVSRAGEEGYPGTVSASVTYTLTNEDELTVSMLARTDQTTLVNLAQHTYWTLGGVGSGSVIDQELTLFSDAYTPGDPQIPTGVIASVAGTPFDFTGGKPIGKDLQTLGSPGYDHNFVVRGDPNTLRPVARLRDPESGRVLSLEADQPGVQLYTANHLNGRLEGKGVHFERHAGVCLETQKFPNAINVPAWRADVVLEPGREYQHRMVFRFSTEPAGPTRP